MKLYYSPGACSLGPHIVLRETGAEAELIPIRVAERENFEPEYLAINPRARVPALEAKGQVFTEAPALMVFLASRNPDAGLLPAPGSTDLARTLEWVAWFNSSLHIAYAQYWRPRRFLPEGADDTLLIEQGKQTIERMSQEVDDRLTGPWLLGEQYTIADAYALAFFRWGYRIGLNMSLLYPRWSGWTEAMLRRNAVRKAIDAEGFGYEHFYPPETVSSVNK